MIAWLAVVLNRCLRHENDRRVGATAGPLTGTAVIAGTISGQVQGTRIEGRIDGSACLYAFAGNRM